MITLEQAINLGNMLGMVDPKFAIYPYYNK